MEQSFKGLVDEIIRFRWESSPVEASFEGIHDYDHLIDHYDLESRHNYFHKIKDYLARLKETSDNSLESAEKLDKRILAAALGVEIKLEEEYKRLDRDAALYPEICLYGTYIILLRNFAPFADRIKSVCGRLGQIPRVLEEGMANLKKGTNIPKLWTEMAIEIVEDGVQFFEFVIPQAAAKSGDLRAEILDANTKAIESFNRYLDFLREDLLPISNGGFQFGSELFAYLLKHQHMLPYSIEELLKIGEETIVSTKMEMEKTGSQIDDGQGWQSLVVKIKKDHPKAEDLLESYRNEMNRAKAFVIENELVEIPENEVLSVIETPLFERTTIPYAAYMPPAPFETRQEGFFWVTPVNQRLPEEIQEEQLQGHNKWGIVLIALHEGYPGHHLQFLHSNRIHSKVRRVFGTPVFAEGWALYCEELMYEKGFYTDPRTRLMQLKDQLWRACRVVIDVKLHTGKMSFSEAVDMLVDVAHLERTNAIAEVKRYTQSPTQPMSYILGKLEILKLRQEYENLKGSKFDLKEFHDRLLSFGTIPIELVRQEMINS